MLSSNLVMVQDKEQYVEAYVAHLVARFHLKWTLQNSTQEKEYGLGR